MVSTRVLDGYINRLSNTEGELLFLYKAAKNYIHSLVRIS